MDVTGFLCVSLGGSTVKLHDSLGSRHVCTCSEAGFCSQNGNRTWRVYYRRTALSCVFFVWRELKDSIQRTFVRKCFLFTVGSVCPLKRFATGSWSSLKDLRKSQMMADQVRKWLRTVKRLLCWGFRRTGKAMGQVYQCWWRTCRDIHVSFQVRISHVLCFISICDLFSGAPWYQHNRLLRCDAV
jgi:hypothetical protein